MGLGIQWDWGTLGRMERDGARGTMGLGHSGTERDGARDAGSQWDRARDTMGLEHNGTEGMGLGIQWGLGTMGQG